MASRLLFWFGVFGAAGAWTLQLVLGYGLEEARCSQGMSDTELPILVLTIAAAAVAAGSLGAAYRAQSTATGSLRFLAVAGLFAGLFFLILIALGGLQLVSLDSCEQG
jgi:hypothetical protein